jgi:hypothetical protein
MVWHESLHELYGFMGFVPLYSVVEDVNCMQAAGVTGDVMLGDKVMDCDHAVVFELGDFDGVFWADLGDVVEE